MRDLIYRPGPKIVSKLNEALFHPPPPGCILYFSGLPGTGLSIYDRSAYGNPGTITGATWERVESSGLWVSSFNGDDYITLANKSLYAVTGTVVAWIYRNANNDGRNHWISDIRPAGGASGWFYVSANTDTYAVSSGTTYTDGVASASLAPLGWHLAAVTGLVMGSTAGNRIGARYILTADNYLNGKIALYRIFNYTMSPPEINKIYQDEKHLFGVV